jgi:hypothetical protein
VGCSCCRVVGFAMLGVALCGGSGAEVFSLLSLSLFRVFGWSLVLLISTPFRIRRRSPFWPFPEILRVLGLVLLTRRGG